MPVVSLLSPLLACALALAPSYDLRVEADTVDADATRRGLELRAGDALAGWRILIRPAPVYDQVEVELRSPAGDVELRTVVLAGATIEVRSRELASALALIVEQASAPPAPPPLAQLKNPPADDSAPRPAGSIAAGAAGAIGFNDAPAPRVGPTLRGGAWLLGEHLQPVGLVVWQRSQAGGLTLDGVRFGAGVAAGSTLGASRSVWLGGAAVPQVQWTRAHETRTRTRVVASIDVEGLLQIRTRFGLLVGVRAGVNILAPSVRAKARAQQIRWESASLAAGLELGIRLPPRPRRR